MRFAIAGTELHGRESVYWNTVVDAATGRVIQSRSALVSESIGHSAGPWQWPQGPCRLAFNSYNRLTRLTPAAPTANVSKTKQVLLGIDGQLILVEWDSRAGLLSVVLGEKREFRRPSADLRHVLDQVAG